MTDQQVFIAAGAVIYWAAFFYSGYVLWVLFLAVMNLSRAREAGRLGPVAYRLALPLIVVAVVVDVVFNLVFGTIGFLQLPHYRRLTLSARMDDLILNGSGWRKRLAVWFVANLLEPFDTTGGHSTHGEVVR